MELTSKFVDFLDSNVVSCSGTQNSGRAREIYWEVIIVWDTYTSRGSYQNNMCINLLTLQANCGVHINIVAKQPTSTNVEHDIVAPYCRFIASVLGLWK